MIFVDSGCWNEKCSFGQIHFVGDLLHHRLGQPLFERADSGRII